MDSVEQSAPEATAIIIADRYRVIERAGQGGSSIVLRCNDLHTGQIVALKLLRSSNPLVPASRARFHREARLAASLSHPNIIRVLDFGETPPPQLGDWSTWIFDNEQSVDFLCMEFVPGPTLKQFLRRLGPCPQEWVLAVGLQLASALRSAHASGIIHRDMKPQNILLVDLAAHVIPRLGDFGIARDLNGATLATLTQTGQVLGTPDYLAPEQVMGESGGKQSDIYALGIVLFEMLTGHLPFEAETPLAAASRRMFVDPPLPRMLVPRISPAVEEAVLRALRREISHRLHSAEELEAALLWAAERDGIEPLDTWPFAPEMLPIIMGTFN
jgi:eukaryotic-like serine/threonine-protein kinase